MIKLGDFKLDNLDCYCEDADHRYIIITLVKGEVDCIFLTNNLVAGRKDIAAYYAYAHGRDDYTCEAYIRTDCPFT